MSKTIFFGPEKNHLGLEYHGDISSWLEEPGWENLTTVQRLALHLMADNYAITHNAGDRTVDYTPFEWTEVKLFSVQKIEFTYTGPGTTDLRFSQAKRPHIEMAVEKGKAVITFSVGGIDSVKKYNVPLDEYDLQNPPKELINEQDIQPLAEVAEDQKTNSGSDKMTDNEKGEQPVQESPVEPAPQPEGAKTNYTKAALAIAVFEHVFENRNIKDVQWEGGHTPANINLTNQSWKVDSRNFEDGLITIKREPEKQKNSITEIHISVNSTSLDAPINISYINTSNGKTLSRIEGVIPVKTAQQWVPDKPAEVAHPAFVEAGQPVSEAGPHKLSETENPNTAHGGILQQIIAGNKPAEGLDAPPAEDKEPQVATAPAAEDTPPEILAPKPPQDALNLEKKPPTREKHKARADGIYKKVPTQEATPQEKPQPLHHDTTIDPEKPSGLLRLGAAAAILAIPVGGIGYKLGADSNKPQAGTPSHSIQVTSANNIVRITGPNGQVTEAVTKDGIIGTFVEYKQGLSVDGDSSRESGAAGVTGLLIRRFDSTPWAEKENQRTDENHSAIAK